MTREDAIRYLERHGFIDDEVKDMCIEALATSTNVSSKWIPCSERLPSVENGEYMICKESGVVMMCSWTKKGWNTVKRNDGTYGETYRFNNVTAWQPLPEPYKGE